MKVLIDIMGGDQSPIELLRGAVEASKTLDAEIVVVCNEPMIREQAATAGISLDSVSILHAPDVITMEDRPMAVIREKNQSSMAVGLRALSRGEADAFISTGNTGALLTGGTLIVRRIKGVQRAALGAIIPLQNPVLLLDSGANLELTPENLEQFAYMGSRYMAHLYGIESPRVGLLNNGIEETKGRELQVETHRLLSGSGDVNFVGNIEPKILPFDVCDVLLADGFSGNLILKYTEGLGKYFAQCMKGMFKSPVSKLAALLIKKQLRAFKSRFDASEHGGAPLLGLSKTVIKAHGSSDAKTITSAVRQAMRVAGTDYMGETAAYLAAKRAEREAVRQDATDASPETEG